ncbi:polysaccharide biosynthesis tyrosine autokinase [Geodermatophilus sp. SYSU D01186]
MELREVLVALRSAWWLPALGLVAGALAALLIGLTQTPSYASHARLYVSATASNSLADAYQGSQLSQARMMSYAQLITSHSLTSRVNESLDLSMSPDELASKITATAVPDTVLLDVTVTDSSPRRAYDIARAVGTEFNDMVAQLESSAASPQDPTAAPIRVSVVTAPEVPMTASSPRTERNVALGALLGLLGGIAASVVRSRRDGSVRDPGEAAQLTGTPVIGAIRRDQGLQQQVFAHAVTGGIAEDYRQLRTNILHLESDDPLKTIMVCSAGPAEGKTSLVINLARALAEAGRRVTLIEADLRRPRMTQYLGLAEGSGLTAVLTGSATIADVVQQCGDEDLYVVPAGPIPADPGGLLASGQMTPLIDALREKNDFVLIDTSPVLAVADGPSLAADVDGVLLAVRYGQTRRQELQQAKTTLDRVGARTLGLVLTVVPPSSGVMPAYASLYGDAPDSLRPQPR